MDIPIAAVLDRALRDAGISITGVSIGKPDDRSTWRVNYAPAATAQQRAAGDALVLAIDPADAVTVNNLKSDMAGGLNTEILQAVALALWEAIPNPQLSKAQLKARIIAIYKSL